MSKGEDWNRFTASGKVMDYLEYKGLVDGIINASNVVPTQGMAGNALLWEDEIRRQDKRAEARVDNERNSQGYRDDTRGISDQRVR